MSILITRHGESVANVQKIISNRDLPHGLTELGISQLLTLAKTLGEWKVNKIFASPIPRAKETASIIAGKLDLPINITPALREWDCGAMEGRGDEVAWAALQTVVDAWDEDQDNDCRIPPDGESFDDIKARFLPFLAEIIEGNENLLGDVLLVSHGGIFHQMMPLVMTNVDRAFTRGHRLNNCGLVVAETVGPNLVCSEWDGIKLI